jgi:multicomponent Na+:H+ antiporter subunit D
MADLARQLPHVAGGGYSSTLVVAAFGLIAGGLAVKVALFPLHTWQPDAYANAPDLVSTLISALVSTVAAYALARVVFSVFTVDFFAAVPLARDALLTLAAVSVVAGSALAVAQRDVRRMLAYSSVSQFGLVVAGFAVASSTAVVGAVVHLVGHAVMKGGLFAAAGVIERRTGARTVEEYAGLTDRAPVAAAGFAVLAFAMVGVPPAVGFVGKWYIVVGAVEAGAWPLIVVLLASTLLTLAYFARLVESMYFTSAPAVSEAEAEAVTAPDAAGAVVPDGGDATVSTGMVAIVVTAAVLAVALGLIVPGIEQALERSLPFLT